jgi:hypothetical protein
LASACIKEEREREREKSGIMMEDKSFVLLGIERREKTH